MFNNVAYFGVSSPVWGTFTMGRQSALTSDLVVNYDALSGSNAWSLITLRRCHRRRRRHRKPHLRQLLRIPPERRPGPPGWPKCRLPNGGNSGTGLAYEGDVGFDYLGFSMDFVGGHIKDAVSVSPPEHGRGQRSSPD